MNTQLLHGDCLELLRDLPDCSVDACVTDPPAGIEFMGREWDSFKERRRSKGWAQGGKDGNDGFGGFATTLRPAFCSQSREDRDNFIAFMCEVFSEVRRVLKPGAHALVWAIPRTSHWTATALEEAGFEVRDVITHHFASGFPKSLDVSKAIDKMAGAERPILGPKPGHESLAADARITLKDGWRRPWMDDPEAVKRYHSETGPATAEAAQWDGWGTALKPASEHWIFCRKPLAEKTVAANVLAHGTGGLNIDGCRIRRASDDASGWSQSPGCKSRGGILNVTTERREARPDDSSGRWPANLAFSHAPECGDQCAEGCPVAELDRQSGVSTSPLKVTQGRRSTSAVPFGSDCLREVDCYGDSGGASRFFFVAKPAASEKNAGLGHIEWLDVEISTWDNAARKVRLRVDTATSPPRVIGVSGTPSSDATEWSMLLFGSDTLAPSLMDCKSITEIRTSSTTASRTLRWLIRSFTSEYTQAVNIETASGGSPAENAEMLSLSLDTTDDETAFLPGVGLVAAPTRLRITSVEGCACDHPTVKAVELMRWLCRLITPPGGTVLDPFAGSGTTGVAAIAEGFSFIGMEQDPQYIAIAQARLDHAEAKRRNTTLTLDFGEP